ncbi:Peptidase S8/S53 domain-containing protein [Artemisia annua]|uniref:Peptidase S8/S53 domain-containing protein n=1 Tax=Artemisia annua TaxID=35608 RepID=A0A2U1Q019_ARTAN|nr:Peptidase S8/S53 domain-containing protein [Artemisia annua]
MFRAITSLLVLTCATIFNVYPTYADELKTYIVHLSSPEGQEFTPSHDREEWYKSLLSKSASITHPKPGFASKMSAEQARVLENMEELHTTRSPSFLGLQKNSFRKSSNNGKGIIIGLLDSGITPGHPSFNDKGVPPPPAKWKGKCELPGCNNKLIGIRNFINGSLPIDEDGHGTHTSSTAAGSPVDNANVFGNANGTATGMAPLAHLAMYKVCGVMSCQGSVMLAGMDAAIEDGVDIISLSVGARISKFYTDELAIGSFAAIQQGIFLSGAAGNLGPEITSLLHEAPWILTVGASTIDRQVRTTVSLGNKKLLDGESVYQNENFNHKFRPLVYPGKDGDKDASMCTEGSLDHIDVKGKVVICDQGLIIGPERSMVVKDAGGAALIITNDILYGETIKAGAYVLPASNVGYKEGLEIKKYLNSTCSPVATILFRGTILGVKSAPQVASFSSRGPNSASPGILKPDIIGPGVDILAAWPNSVDNKTTKATFNIISGTSMSCPHLAGTAALLKSAHPEWSPAAIKSAIMTTATHVSLDGHAIRDGFNKLPADIFTIGSGHVNPSKANDPGLVFDIQPDDYIPYLCGLGYTPKQVQMIVRKTVSCLKTIPEAQLNYPSFAVSLTRGDSKTYSRKMTNVGLANSTYTIKDISAPDGVTVIVGSGFQELSFTEMHQKLEYEVQFTWHHGDEVKVRYGQGHMTWVSGRYSVRTPFAFTFE